MSLARMRELSVISVLRAHPAHGYGVATFLSRGPGALLGLSRAAIYGILDRLERAGLVTVRTEPGGAHPDRRIYTLTQTGVARFDDLQATADPVDLPVAPLAAMLLAADAGGKLPDLRRSIKLREDLLLQLEENTAGHENSAFYKLALVLITSELKVLRQTQVN